MRELPLIFDDWPDGPAATTRSAVATETDRPPWPWWMAVARLVGRLHPRLTAAGSADARAFRRLPRWVVLVGMPLGVVVLALAVSAFHASSNILHSAPQVDWLRLRIDDVYTESPPFLLAAIALGVLSPALGAFLVVAFGISDLAASVFQPSELTPLPSALAARLVAIWLLWLLAVEVPLAGRQLALSWRRVAGNRLVVAGLAAVSTGAGVWLWTQAATVLIRPIFRWSSTPGVTLEAVQPVQVAGLAFAIAGGLVAGAVAYGRGPSGLIDEPGLGPAQPSSGPLAIAGRFVRRIVVAGLLTVGLGGLITAPIEAAVLFVALLGTAPLARFVADRTAIGTLVLALPPIARYVIAAALAFGLALVTIGPLYTIAANDSTGNVPQFFSVIVAVVIGMFVVQVATTPASANRRPATLATTALVAVVVAGASTLLLLAVPLPVSADNCQNLSDCWGTPFLAALAGASLPTLLAMAAWSAFTTPAPRPDKRIWPGYRSSRPPEMPPGYKTPTINEYGPVPKPPPGGIPSDGKSISEQAVASSGAGTKA